MAIHARIVQPLLDMTLLFLGLPLVVTRESRNVFVAMGICMVVTTAFTLVVVGMQEPRGDLLLDLHPLAGGLDAADDLRSAGGVDGRRPVAIGTMRHAHAG